MDSEINNKVVIVYLDKMIYHAIYEIRCKLSKRANEKRIFSFVKEFLDSNEIAESTFRERLRTLGIEVEIVDKPLKKGNSSFLSKSNSYASVNSSDISYNPFPSSTPLCPQDLRHDSSIISEEIETLDKIIKTSSVFQTFLRNVLALQHKWVISSAEHVDSGVGTNNDLFAANKSTETDSDCHQHIGTLREAILLWMNLGTSK